MQEDTGRDGTDFHISVFNYNCPAMLKKRRSLECPQSGTNPLNRYGMERTWTTPLECVQEVTFFTNSPGNVLKKVTVSLNRCKVKCSGTSSCITWSFNAQDAVQRIYLNWTIFCNLFMQILSVNFCTKHRHYCVYEWILLLITTQRLQMRQFRRPSQIISGGFAAVVKSQQSERYVDNYSSWFV